MRFLGFLLVFILFGTTMLAQQAYDTIVFVNGKKQAAKIIEISKKQVRFKNVHDTLGPTFNIDSKSVDRFIFKDGCLELDQFGYYNCVKDPTDDYIKNEDFTRTIISIELLQFVIKHFQISAEHIFKNKKLGLYAAFNSSFLDETNKLTYNRRETIYNSDFFKKNYGIFDLKIYPFEHKKIIYVTALGFDFGNAYYQIHKTTYKTKEARYMGYHLNNGFIWRIQKHLICQGWFSLGVNKYKVEEKTVVTTTFSPKLGAGVSIGCSF